MWLSTFRAYVTLSQGYAGRKQNHEIACICNVGTSDAAHRNYYLLHGAGQYLKS